MRSDSLPGQRAAPRASLDRGLGPWGAISTNILNMVGVGPFLTIPLALAAMGGPQAMVGWLLGAGLCLCDGLVWAELGAALPNSGGPYYYLLEAFGRTGPGRLMSFLFLWQTLLTGPLSIASGAVGFSEYMSFIAPGLTHPALVFVAVLVCLANAWLLYRNIRSIDRLSVAITVVVMATCCWIVISGALHFHPALAFHFPPGAFHMSGSFWAGLGATTLIAVYDYGGYSNVCLLGGEIEHPSKNIPRAVIFSILLVAGLYLLMNVSIIGSLDWRVAQHSHAVVADFMQLLYGHWAGVLISVLVLVVSFGAVFANMLGYSRIPWAAAVEGSFFRPFARLHKTGKFPTVSLLFMGVASAIASVFSLAELIKVLIVVQAIFQFAAQCVAVELLRRRGLNRDSYRMPLYPLPAIIALLGWIYIALSSGWRYVGIGMAMAVAGTGIYFLKAQHERSWPFRAL
ncbi:MAG TPA: APC family permease [Acidobacteriaceae bacterium]|nr:APC family permease [Acidobacteriaceae bacterium]